MLSIQTLFFSSLHCFRFNIHNYQFKMSFNITGKGTTNPETFTTLPARIKNYIRISNNERIGNNCR